MSIFIFSWKIMKYMIMFSFGACFSSRFFLFLVICCRGHIVSPVFSSFINVIDYFIISNFYIFWEPFQALLVFCPFLGYRNFWRKQQQNFFRKIFFGKVKHFWTNSQPFWTSRSNFMAKNVFFGRNFCQKATILKSGQFEGPEQPEGVQ